MSSQPACMNQSPRVFVATHTRWDAQRLARLSGRKTASRAKSKCCLQQRRELTGMLCNERIPLDRCAEFFGVGPNIDKSVWQLFRLTLQNLVNGSFGMGIIFASSH